MIPVFCEVNMKLYKAAKTRLFEKDLELGHSFLCVLCVRVCVLFYSLA